MLLKAALPLNWFLILKAEYGSITSAADVVGCDRSAMYRWNKGLEQMPTKHLIKILGLVRQISYAASNSTTKEYSENSFN